ncbi:MAG: DUF368 domain-containing protein [Nitriliruptorales bacterium]
MPDDAPAGDGRFRQPLEVALQLARGFTMGSADLIPGVSGGTMALLFGIYEHLVATIKDGAAVLGRAVRGDVRTAARRIGRVDWWFLVPLLAGILAAIVTLAGVVGELLDERPVTMSGLFFGLIVGAVVVTFLDIERRDPTRALVAVAAAVVTFLLLGIRSAAVHDPSLLVAFGAGAVAICAMILPGISGAFILLLLGVYRAAIGAVDGRDLVLVGAFGLGAVVGLASFSTALHWLLRRYHDTVVAALVGLMAGSLRVLWPWPTDPTLGVGDVRLGAPVSGEVPATLGATLAGLVLLLLLAWAGRLREA